MKLKRLPEDFHVEELPVVAQGEPRGRFVYYRLTKRGLGTLEAIEAISRRWNVPGRRISYGGLKDRHAVTVQYLTIFEGPERPLHEQASTSSRSGGFPNRIAQATFGETASWWSFATSHRTPWTRL